MKKTTSYTLEPEVIEYIQEQAKLSQRSASSWLELLIKNIMKENNDG